MGLIFNTAVWSFILASEVALCDIPSEVHVYQAYDNWLMTLFSLPFIDYLTISEGG